MTDATTQRLAPLDYRPKFPAEQCAVAIVGCGTAAKDLHLPAYAAWGVDIAGVYDPAPAATDGVRERFPFVRQVYSSLDELLADPKVTAVDIATRPAERPELILRAIDAGKHVLAQKPLAPDLDAAKRVIAAADEKGVRLAVNQNGRWAPQWRAATRLIESGAMGRPFAVTHLHDKGLPPLAGRHFDELDHFETEGLLTGSKERNWLWLGLIISLAIHFALCTYFYRTRFASADAVFAQNEQTPTFKVKRVLDSNLDKSSADQINPATKPNPDNTDVQLPDEKKSFDKLLEEVQASTALPDDMRGGFDRCGAGRCHRRDRLRRRRTDHRERSQGRPRADVLARRLRARRPDRAPPGNHDVVRHPDAVRAAADPLQDRVGPPHGGAPDHRPQRPRLHHPRASADRGQRHAAPEGHVPGAGSSASSSATVAAS